MSITFYLLVEVALRKGGTDALTMYVCADLLKIAVALGASDLHVTVGSAPVLRLHGVLWPLDDPEFKGKLTELSVESGIVISTDKLAPEDTTRLARELMTNEQWQMFKQKGEIDFAYTLEGVSRFRVNAFHQQGLVSLAIRVVPSAIPSLPELGLPDAVANLAFRPNGLVLVTGPTGSGKSTTLAAMIDLINSSKRCHIITLEDPIEYVHRHKKSIINQREIGRDSQSFATALRSALREDPDVILVGEMRDPETIAIAVTAAETGHLVLATLHTVSAAQTIDRIIDVFPPHQQPQIRVQLANTLQGIISQQLLPRIDRPGRVLALEILITTPAIRNLIREGKTYQIISQIQTGARLGMITLDGSLRELYRKGIISREEVLSRAMDPEVLSRML